MYQLCLKQILFIKNKYHFLEKFIENKLILCLYRCIYCCCLVNGERHLGGFEKGTVANWVILAVDCSHICNVC